jgi:hypothetical protein
MKVQGPSAMDQLAPGLTYYRIITGSGYTRRGNVYGVGDQ